jgi:dihydroorotate dehydrogenase (NAD+) catalytic subunit
VGGWFFFKTNTQLTHKRRRVNKTPRLVETPAGLLNSIGLANVGVEDFVKTKWPYLQTLPCAIIPNVAGSSADEYCGVVEKLEEQTTVWGYEINLSCPNVKEGCLAFGTNPQYIEKITKSLRARTTKPLIIKLTPNVTDMTILARAAEAGGADAVSCINTLTGMVIDTKTKRPVLPGLTGGLSGPAIRPVGVAFVYKVSQAVTIPVIGLGGIMCGSDALQYLLAGASAIQVGTGNFVDPTIPEKILAELEAFGAQEGLATITDVHRFKKSWTA